MTVARDFWQLVRISWLWLAIMLPMYAAVHWLTWSWATEAAQREGGAPALLMALLANVIELPAQHRSRWAGIGWFSSRSGRGRRLSTLRLDRVVWTYAFVLRRFLC